MKKIFIFIISILLIPIVYAENAEIYFYPEGGRTTSNGFIIENNLVKLTDGTYYATYNTNSTVSNLQSIGGNSFIITKTGYILAQGKEWYALDINGNKHYFSNSKNYTIADIIQELKLNGSLITIDLHANWTKPEDPTKPKNITKLSLDKTEYSLTEKDTYQLQLSYEPKDATNVNISWSSSDDKIAQVNNNGKITAVKKGTATITAKSSNGQTATCKITVVTKKAAHVYIQYNINGGKLTNVNNKSITEKDGFIYYNGKKEVTDILLNNSLPKTGLANYNNPNFINIKRDNYAIIAKAEWNTEPDGSGTSYSQTKEYKASDFCSNSNGCKITLYANWKSEKKLINISLNINGGTLATPHNKRVTISNNLVSFNGDTKYINILYDGTLGNTGLSNYNNPNFLNITRDGYKIEKDAEWNTKPDGTGTSCSQYKKYKGSDFCSNKNGCNITLYANWKANSSTNDVDVVLLWGQSNMVGYPARGAEVDESVKDTRKLDSKLYNDSNNPYDDDIIANYAYMNYEKYTIKPDIAWEYKYEDGNGGKLVDLYNNGVSLKFFGENIIAKENNAKASQQSYGTNMVPYFAKAYTGETNHKLVIIHAGIGGKKIECFLPVNDKDYKCDQKRYMYEYMVKKYKNAIKLLQKKGYTVKNKFYVVLQGAANSNKSSYDNY